MLIRNKVLILSTAAMLLLGLARATFNEGTTELLQKQTSSARNLQFIKKNGDDSDDEDEDDDKAPSKPLRFNFNDI